MSKSNISSDLETLLNTGLFATVDCNVTPKGKAGYGPVCQNSYGHLESSSTLSFKWSVLTGRAGTKSDKVRLSVKVVWRTLSNQPHQCAYSTIEYYDKGTEAGAQGKQT